jgi:hypothetical protein
MNTAGRSITIRQPAAFALLMLALIPAGVLAWRARHFEHLGYFHDDGMYWIAGKSLAEGQGYRILSFPGTPYQTKYPPVLPLLVSLVWKAFPEFPANLPWAMLLAAAMLPAFAWVSVRLLESWGCSRPTAMLVCAWMLLNPYVVFMSVNLMADLLFTIVLGCCLLAAQKAEQQDSRRRALVAGILGGLAYLVKTAAIPLLAAGPIWFALRRKSRLALWFAAPLLVCVVAWNAWAVRHATHSTDGVTIYYTSYLGDFLQDLHPLDLATFFLTNIRTFVTSIGDLLIPHMERIPWLGPTFALLVGLFAMIGVIRRMNQDGAGLQHWFAGGYSLLVLAWHYPPNERFLIPILPLFAYGAQAELRHLGALLRTAWHSGKSDQRVTAGIIAVALGAVCLWGCSMVIVAHCFILPGLTPRYRAQLESNRKVYEWINQNISPAEPILTAYDATAFLYTGHPASRLPNFPKQYYRQNRQAVARAYAEVPAFARSRGVRYLMLCETDFDTDLFVKAIVDWKRLTSGPSYRLLVKAPMTELYEIEAPR